MNESFIHQLAQPRPDPGGGGAAAYAACVAVALLEKILRLEAGRKSESAEQAGLWAEMLDRSRALSTQLHRLRDEDSLSYMKFSEAKRSGEHSAWDNALAYATSCPVEIAENACSALGLALEAGRRCSIRLLSDILASCELLAGTGRAACRIAQANMALMHDGKTREHFEFKLKDIFDDLDRKKLEANSLQSSRR